MLREATGPLEASIFVEGLRAIPAAFVAFALLLHALLWAIAAQFAEPSPPPQMAIALALGREWLLGYTELPPLAVWASEAIFRATNSLFPLRLATAFSVALAGWLLFLFARRIVGERQGAIAVLLLVSIFPVAFPGSALTGDILQMPLIAAAILSWWIAVGERNSNAWMLLGLTLGISVYAGPQGVVLLVVLILVSLLSARVRAAINRFDSLLAVLAAFLIFVFIAGPRLFWLWQNGTNSFSPGLGAGISPAEALSPLRLAATLLAGHFGFALLVFLATAYATRAKENAPVFVREPAALFSRRSVMALAIAPAVLALVWLYASGQAARPQLLSSLLMLGGIAAVLMGGERLIVRRQMLVGGIAIIFLLVPPLMHVVLSFVPGWLGENRTTNWPATAAARTFTEIFRTRTGRPLEFIAGDRISAAQIAATSADHPHLVADADILRSPWADEAEFKRKGGVVFWEIRGADASPPAAYVSKLPAFTPEAPLRLPWSRGGGDPVRLGWAIIPPVE